MIKKEKYIGIRCSEEEKTAMQIKAHESYKTLSKYLRDLALNHEQ